MASVLIVGICGYFLFPDVTLNIQVDLAKILATTATTLFAILNVWIAVLDPQALLECSDTIATSPSRNLAASLLQPLLYATSIFATTVLQLLC